MDESRTFLGPLSKCGSKTPDDCPKKGFSINGNSFSHEKLLDFLTETFSPEEGSDDPSDHV